MNNGRPATLPLPIPASMWEVIFMATPEAISVTRISDGRYLAVNTGWLRLAKRQLDEVIGKTSLELGIWSNAHDREILVQRLERDGQVDNLEVVLVDGRGRHVQGLMSARPLDLDGEACLLAITRDISERKMHEELIRELAYSDPLTQLPNRRAVLERLTLAMAASERTGQHCAVIYLDLDKFKSLNDQWGHDYGDLLLFEVAQRLKGGLRATDLAARIGGDEFVVLLPDLPADIRLAEHTVRGFALRLSETLRTRYALEARDEAGHSRPPVYFQCTASLGLALCTGKREYPEQVLARADLAMYQAKKSGGSQIRVSLPEPASGKKPSGLS